MQEIAANNNQTVILKNDQVPLMMLVGSLRSGVLLERTNISFKL